MSTAGYSPPGLGGRIFRIKACTIAAWLLTWEALARSGFFYQGVVPRVDVVVHALMREVLDSGFYHELAIPLIESIVGFVFGSLIAVALGIALGSNPFLRRMIEPFIVALGGTPKIIFCPSCF